jgi:hypothetical protein
MEEEEIEMDLKSGKLIWDGRIGMRKERLGWVRLELGGKIGMGREDWDGEGRLGRGGKIGMERKDWDGKKD